MENDDVVIKSSRGFSRRHVRFLMPSNGGAANKPRRVTGVTYADLQKNIEKTIKRYYTPMHYYFIEGKMFGSNNAVNALAEWDRICDKEDIGKDVTVTLIESI